jgi:phospholipid transport system transporter-binding protein
MSNACTIEVGEQGCLNLTGALTFESTPGLYREAEKLFSGPSPVSSVDLSGVTTVDSAGLALLLEWQAGQRPASRSLHIINSPSSLMSLARLCDAIDLINISGRSREG